MAWTYNIENAFGTVTLNSNGCQVLDYSARSAPVMDGNETVEEPFRILITGTSRANVDAIVGTIQRAFRDGERWQNNQSGARTFFARSLADDTVTKRSEFVGADFTISSMEYIGTSIYGGHFGTYKTELSGVLTRRNWWEGAEAQIPLTNPNGTANTTGLAIFNNNCGTGTGTLLHYNVADFVGTSIIGDLPADYRLEITQRTAYSGWQLSVGEEVSAKGTAPSSGLNSFESVRVMADFSYGTALANRTWGTVWFAPGSLTIGTTYPAGALTSYSGFDYFADSGYYRLYSVLSFNVSQTYLAQPFIYTDVWENRVEGPPIYISGGTTYKLYDFGIMKWPPSNYKAGYLSDEVFPGFVLSAGTAFILSSDYIEFCRNDGYRQYATMTGSSSVIVDDTLDSQSAFLKSGTTLLGDINTVGNMRLYPGKTHRLNFHATYTDDVNLKNISWAVKLYYRPRYLTL